MNNAETILVSRSGSVLVVGKKTPGKAVKILNAFEGKEAEELWEKLTVKKEKGDASSSV